MRPVAVVTIGFAETLQPTARSNSFVVSDRGGCSSTTVRVKAALVCRPRGGLEFLELLRPGLILTWESWFPTELEKLNYGCKIREERGQRIRR